MSESVVVKIGRKSVELKVGTNRVGVLVIELYQGWEGRPTCSVCGGGYEFRCFGDDFAVAASNALKTFRKQVAGDLRYARSKPNRIARETAADVAALRRKIERAKANGKSRAKRAAEELARVEKRAAKVLAVFR